jgi:hypothetical protein
VLVPVDSDDESHGLTYSVLVSPCSGLGSTER